MVSVVRDTQWPFVGDKVTLTATSMSGQRARFHLTAKPPASALAIYDANDDNYLDGTEKQAFISPDADGTYTIRCRDYSVNANPPHYSGHGSTGASIGVEVVATVASSTYTLRVGRVMQRAIGFPPHACTMTVRAHGDSSMATTAGVMTYVAGAGYAPTLTGATTDRADQAMRATGVTTQLAALGGTGYGGSSALLSWTSVLGTSDVIRHMAFFGMRLDSHISSPAWPVHVLADSWGSSSVSTAAVGTSLASCITRLNAIRTAQINHYQNDTAHGTVVIEVFPNALGSGASFASAAARYVTLAGKNNTHVDRVWTTAAVWTGTLGTNYVHYPPGATWQTSTTGTPASTSALATYTRSLCQTHMRHREKYYTASATYSVNNNYHNGGYATGTSFNVYGTAATQVGYIPRTMVDVPQFVNDCVDAFNAHVKNEFRSGGTTLAHGNPDIASAIDWVPRASPADIESAVLAFEVLEKYFTAHVMLGLGTHYEVSQASGATGANTDWYYALDGMSLLHAEFQDALAESAATVPPNENVAAAKLVKLGGWRKT